MSEHNKEPEEGAREQFDIWLKSDEQQDGCRGLSNLERDQMFAAWCASYQGSSVPDCFADKAEVEPGDSYKAGYADGMEEGAKLALWGDKPSEKFPEGWPAEIWLNAGDDELGPFSEYDDVSWCSAPQGESDIRYIREDLLATPPVTTGCADAPHSGASTAPATIVVKAGNAFIAPPGAKVVHEEDQVVASTVLTDERIDELWKVSTVKSLDQAKPVHKVFARAIEHEVAAQAGQVAVPEGWHCDLCIV